MANINLFSKTTCGVLSHLQAITENLQKKENAVVQVYNCNKESEEKAH